MIEKSAARSRGVVLLVVLGVLVVLVLLATTFAVMQSMERQVTRNYLDTVRARLLAQSGLEDMLSRLDDFESLCAPNAPGAPRPWKFWGRDKTETVEPLDTDRVDLAVNPSFALEATVGNQMESPQNPFDANVTPKTLRVEGREVGLSGVFDSGSYARNGDQYAVRVTDVSGRLFINDGVDGDTASSQGSVTQNLKRILNILGKIPEIGIAGLGDKIVGSRPRNGYRSAKDLLQVLTEAEYRKIENLVTVHSWVDKNVCNPVPLSAAVAERMEAATGVKYYRGTPALYRFGSHITGLDSARRPVTVLGAGLDLCEQVCPAGLRHDNAAIKLYGLDTLNPQYIEVVSRAPVNVNTVPQEILVAVLTDLKGFFVMDRRRTNPSWAQAIYNNFTQQNLFSPDGITGDEIGWLQGTYPIIGPGSTVADGISAFDVADEIIACRNKAVSKWFDYSTVAWGGPFQTWRQFNMFADNLVAIGLLNDPRTNLYVDWPDSDTYTDHTGYTRGDLVPSEPQRKFACQAIADVLKANFNPNLHLNEMNPDANLFTIVDKTDLLVNSTEFCFLPTGYFEVESVGRVVRPRGGGGQDAFLAADNVLVAQARVSAVYKLYNTYRETSQKQFYGGTLSPKQGAFETNNGMSVEIGPEPDNGVFPGNLGANGDADNEWDGYVALPTVGGPSHSGWQHDRNKLDRTLNTPDSEQFGAKMHVHFALDFDACHSVVGREEIGSRALAGENVVNFPDVVGGSEISYGGPYSPSSMAVGGVANHRMARSFRLSSEPSLTPYAPSDLRVDGGYSERHACPSYYVHNGTQAIWPEDERDSRVIPEGADASLYWRPQSNGMFSFWWKPSYFPNLTGKVRSVFDFGRFHDNCYQGGIHKDVHVFPFNLWFFPCHHDPRESERDTPKYTGWEIWGRFHPASLCGGSYQWHGPRTEINNALNGTLYAPEVGPEWVDYTTPPHQHLFGNLTGCLNHLSHEEACVEDPSPLRAHRWIQTTFLWQLDGNVAADVDTADHQVMCKMYVNGTQSYAIATQDLIPGGLALVDMMSLWKTHDGGEANQLRLGAASLICEAAKAWAPVNGAYRGNHTGDHTVDEFYIWKKNVPGEPWYWFSDVESRFPVSDTFLWRRGRYYKPESGGDSVFTSQPFSLDSPRWERLLAPSSAAALPGEAWPPSPGSGSEGASQVRVLGMSWTWYGEGVDANVEGMKPTLYNYNDPMGAEQDMSPRISMGIVDGALTYSAPGPSEDARARHDFWLVQGPDGEPAAIRSPWAVRYFARFSFEDAPFDAILLATPVLDDVMIFWDDSHPRMVSYVFDTRSF